MIAKVEPILRMGRPRRVLVLVFMADVRTTDGLQMLLQVALLYGITSVLGTRDSVPFLVQCSTRTTALPNAGGTTPSRFLP
jgi:hypothetical protein